MEVWLRQHAAKLLGLGGAVITVAGLASFHTWRDGLGTIGWGIRDNPVSASVLVFGIVLLVAANWDRLRTLIWGTQRWSTEAELGDELNKWMRDAGWAVQNLKPQPGAEGKAAFGFAATDDSGRIINVTKALGIPAVMLISGLQPAPAEVVVIQGMTPEQKGSLVEDLGLDLARFGLGFKVTSEPDWELQIHDNFVVAESLTPSEFGDRATRIIRALLLAQIIFARHVREAQRARGATNLVPVPQSSSDAEDSPIG